MLITGKNFTVETCLNMFPPGNFFLWSSLVEYRVSLESFCFCFCWNMLKRFYTLKFPPVITSLVEYWVLLESFCREILPVEFFIEEFPVFLWWYSGLFTINRLGSYSKDTGTISLMVFSFTLFRDVFNFVPHASRRRKQQQSRSQLSSSKSFESDTSSSGSISTTFISRT